MGYLNIPALKAKFSSGDAKEHDPLCTSYPIKLINRQIHDPLSPGIACSPIYRHHARHAARRVGGLFPVKGDRVCIGD